MTTNRAVWQEQFGQPSIIRAGTIPSDIPSKCVLVKAHAFGMNPADNVVQSMDLGFAYPMVLGEDVAGIVETVGDSASSKFKVGDRVFGLAIGATSGMNERAAFQEYVVLDETTVCKMPDALSFSDAAVFPLCLITAALALFSKKFLNMPYPTLNAASNGQTIFIGGGSSCVGCNAIQLSRAAGFEVVASCSAPNFDLVKSLGAKHVFDYNSASFVQDVAAQLDKADCFGSFQATGSPASLFQIAAKMRKGPIVFATNAWKDEELPVGVDARILRASPDDDLSYPTNIYREALEATFTGFLPEAIDNGSYKVAPAVEIAPTSGLEGIQEALDILKKGVSAKKVVVKMQ